MLKALARLGGFVAIVCASAVVAAADDPAAVLERIRSTRLDVDHPLELDNVRLDTGSALLRLDEGFLFPARDADGAVAEMVFVGRGTVELEPPDEIEAGQLELFTGASRLSESFTEAVFVIAHDGAAHALVDRPVAEEVDADVTERARQRFASWIESSERRFLDVESARLFDALGDPFYSGQYFAGWFEGEELGRFLLLVDPNDAEQITLGQFVPLDATEKEKRRLARQLHKQKQQGRLMGVELADLGVWDTWLSSPITQDAEARPGLPTFEPERYTLDVTVDPRSDELRGHARLDLVAVTGQRHVTLELHSDLVVESVRDAAGTELFHLRSGSTLYALLPEPPERSSNVALEVEYAGSFFHKGGDRNWALRDTLSWYPHAGEIDRARYDVTLRWPKKLDLVAAGHRIEGGEDGNFAWERRTYEVPTLGFSFEVGRFKVRTVQAGHVTVTVAFDPAIRGLSAGSLDEIPDTIADALTYYEEIFSPYPLDELTVVTVPRLFSQAMLGFVTLSDVMMADLGILGALFGFEDRRTVIAHEIAHQWWGNLVGWKSYRDQWISEAMASYSALLWARNRLPVDERPLVGPTSGWQTALTAQLADGRPIESLGPVVLGQRLHSSHTSDAYEAIVYRKGAVVLDMLARRYSEETFIQVLGILSRAAANKVVSTADFLDLIERITESELDGFGDQFVYGTGLPRVNYTYELTPTGDGKWRVVGTATQEAPYRYRYEVVSGDGGRLDVERTRLEQIEVEGSTLVVPFQILLAEEGGGKKKKDDGKREVMTGRLLVDGLESGFDIPIDREPERFWLDRRREVFGRFSDATRQPKAILARRGRELAAAGDLAGAEEVLRQALATPPWSDEDDRQSDVRYTTKSLNAQIHLELARVQLDTGRDTEAAASLDAARQAVPGAAKWWFRPREEVLRARWEVRQGQYEAAFKRLRKSVLKRRSNDDAESVLLLAIAAREVGESGDFETALEWARENGADVALLE